MTVRTKFPTTCISCGSPMEKGRESHHKDTKASTWDYSNNSYREVLFEYQTVTYHCTSCPAMFTTKDTWHIPGTWIKRSGAKP